jgi:hypothetical protein
MIGVEVNATPVGSVSQHEGAVDMGVRLGREVRGVVIGQQAHGVADTATRATIARRAAVSASGRSRSSCWA